MSIIEKMSKIVNDGDSAGAEQLIHDDYQFLMHSNGKSLTKKDVVGWVGMKDVKKSNVRVLFENEEVGFEHAMVTFNDGNKEASLFPSLKVTIACSKPTSSFSKSTLTLLFLTSFMPTQPTTSFLVKLLPFECIKNW